MKQNLGRELGRAVGRGALDSVALSAAKMNRDLQIGDQVSGHYAMVLNALAVYAHAANTQAKQIAGDQLDDPAQRLKLAWLLEEERYATDFRADLMVNLGVSERGDDGQPSVVGSLYFVVD